LQVRITRLTVQALARAHQLFLPCANVNHTEQGRLSRDA
jgi:hypothetical protein